MFNNFYSIPKEPGLLGQQIHAKTRRDKIETDILIIGSGPAAGAFAYSLRNINAKVLILEKGGVIPQEKDNWNKRKVIVDRIYAPKEKWYDTSGREFFAAVRYNVGGQSKFYGTSLLRMRAEDFEDREHEDGISPAWPIRYDDIEPFYCEAETLYKVHGKAHEDPAESKRSQDFPYPPIEHEDYVQNIVNRLRNLGMKPFCLPVGIDYGPQGACIKCATCAGFPCKLQAKSDAESCTITPAIASANIELWTHTEATKIVCTDDGKKVEYVEVVRKGQPLRIYPSTVVLGCNAVNSTLLLLKSASARYPDGLANSSGLLGRNYMQHVNSHLLAIDLKNKHNTKFQKTLALNDFYFGAYDSNYPLGSIQLSGNAHIEHIFKINKFGLNKIIPNRVYRFLAEHGLGWFLMTEDLPLHQNRVFFDGDRVTFNRRITNLNSHRKLLKKTTKLLRQVGFQFVLPDTQKVGCTAHYCGTMKMGHEPETSVLNANCQTHDIENLYVVDASGFCSSSAVNLVLTIVANSLRSADIFKKRHRLTSKTSSLPGLSLHVQDT